MHEISLAQNLLDIVRQEMHKHGADQLVSVKIKSGRLNALVPEIMQTVFQALTAGTPLEGAQLEIETVPLRLACEQCAGEFFPEGDQGLLAGSPCPFCGREFGHRVLSGRELNIEYIDVE